MEIYFLGTGTSVGIPVIGIDHPVGRSKNQKDKRLRSSILIKWEDTTILIDCGPDFRQQMLKAKCNKIDAILFTHEHADHVAGLDEIRTLCYLNGAMPLYGIPRVLDALERRYEYIFATENRYPGAPKVEPIAIEPFQEFKIGDKSITALPILHGDLDILGFSLGDFVYITDAKYVDQKCIDQIKGCKVLVVNALRISEHPTHFSLEQALEFIEKVQPQRAYLTHISQDLGFHEKVQKVLPKDVYLAFDNLKINL